ncbi:AMMECR1 domain-containing protein [Clostridium ganghwense]|uniref:AMMECR1 family protein n=1 Tax=Clostridium ganghwense TaxID=312089 RepID=A0ABT4CR11_9CLOT|nr:AMMECR1 domain-containing protein [Clostridium ganghwense]MCY6371358.1 AMMECR1 family protein [Clostridium ganghwense]
MEKVIERDLILPSYCRIRGANKFEDIYAKLARQSLEYYIKKSRYLRMPLVHEKMLNQRHGVFVVIKKEGEIRGWKGTVHPTTDCIAREIIKNAVEAGCYNRKFSKVKREELSKLEYSIYIINSIRAAKKEELDPKKYGVYVKCGFKSAYLLPNLYGTETAEGQLQRVLRKAEIGEYEEYTLEKFEVIKRGYRG